MQPINSLTFFNNAITAENNGDINGAKILFDQILDSCIIKHKNGTENGDDCYVLGMMYYYNHGVILRQGRESTGLLYFEIASNKFNHPEACIELALYFIKQNNIEEAKKKLTKASENNEKAKELLATLL